VRIVAAISFILLAATAVRAADTQPDKTYPITVVPQLAPGDSYDVEISIGIANTEIITAPGADPRLQQSAVRASLTGRVHIEKVGPRGFTDLSLIITKFVEPLEGRDFVPPGKTLAIVRGDRGVTFTIRGGDPLTDEARRILGFPYAPLTVYGLTPEEILGTKQPRKIGESWEVSAGVARNLLELGRISEAKAVRGNSTLKALEDSPLGPALRISSNLDIANLVPPDLPPDLGFDSGQHNNQFEELVSFNPPVLVLETKGKTESTLHVTEKVTGVKHEYRAQIQITESFKNFQHK
jgi:hypothetical protein